MNPWPGSLRPAGEVAERAIASASGDCVVIVEEGSSAEVRFANNTTTTNGARRERRVTAIAIGADGRRCGSASETGAVDVAELVARAEHQARQAPPADDAAPLVRPQDGGASDDLSLAPELVELSALGGLLPELRDAFGRGRAEGHRIAGFATHEVTTTYLATSSGLRRRHVQPSGTVELVARDGDGARSAWVGQGIEDFGDCSIAEMEGRLLERLGWARRRVELPAGRYETVLPPDAVADLMVVLSQAASGREAEDGGSVFSTAGGTRLGEQVSPLPFSLLSDPARPGLSCCPFLVTDSSGPDVSVFDNGAVLGPTAWIEAGRLAHLRYHRAGATRAGVAFTPPVDNLALELPGATASLADLVAGTRRGLLLTCLWYIREVDQSTLLLTGLTRDGVYLVEDGEVVAAVNNFRFNESPLDLLARATAASRVERALSREWGEWMRLTAMPALQIPDFNFSSVSPAS